MKWLNYHHLLYFREIATQGSVSKAAETLRLGQPALSAQLKKLEQNFGYSLFERKNRKLVLTETGKRTLQYANEVYQSGHSLLEMIEKGVLHSRLQLNIGALDCVPKHLILQLIADAKKKENCQIKLIGGNADELLRELQSHNLDLFISNHHAPISEEGGVFSRPLTKHAISIFGSPDFKALKKSFPRSLNDSSFILPCFQSKLRHDIEHYFKLNNLQFRVFTETQDTSIQKLLCLEGYGLIALPDFSTKELVMEGKLIKLGEITGVFEEFWIISAKKTIDNPITTFLAKHFSVRPT